MDKLINNEDTKNYRSITTRMIVIIIMASGVITAIITAFTLYLDFKFALTSFNNSIRQMEISTIPTIEQLVWDYNSNELTTLLKSSLNIQGIEKIELLDPENISLGLYNKAKSTGQYLEQKKYPLYYDNNFLGNLNITVSKSHIYSGLITKALYIFLFQGIKTFVISFFMLFLFHFYITRHLENMVKFFTNFNYDSFKKDPYFLSLDNKKNYDEIDILVKAVNQMIEKEHERKFQVFENERALRNLFNNMQDCFFRISREGKIIDCSPSFYKLLKIDKNKEVLVTDILDDRTLLYDLYKRLKRDELLTNEEIIIQNSQNSIIPVSVNANFYHDYPSRKIAGIEGFIHDISSVKETEAKLLEARDLALRNYKAKSEFLANISHEVRTPMHGIISFAKFGIKKIHKAEKETLLHYFHSIHESSNQLMKLMDDLLDLSKIESGKMSYNKIRSNMIDIVQGIIDEFHSMCESKNIKIIMRKEDHFSPECFIDPLRISQVIRNLIINAIKFSRPNEIVEVIMNHANVHVDNENVQGINLKIIDQGIGLPVSESHSIFEAFTQSSYTNDGSGGVGLGLTISKEIIEFHQGRIWAENNENKSGSTFQFLIPIYPVAHNNAEESYAKKAG
jgi:PAS domain S-box-containing protein